MAQRSTNIYTMVQAMTSHLAGSLVGEGGACGTTALDMSQEASRQMASLHELMVAEAQKYQKVLADALEVGAGLGVVALLSNPANIYVVVLLRTDCLM